jgi:hypothetical protein
MTTRKARGYGGFDDTPSKDALSFPLLPHIDAETMGFRLAVDGEPQSTFGGSWGNHLAVASVPGVLGANPRSSAAFISFRLAKEEG